MAHNSSILDKYKIPDKHLRESLKEIEKLAQEGKAGNAKTFQREITYNEIHLLKEDVRYIGISGNGVEVVYRVGNDLYFQPLTKKDK